MAQVLTPPAVDTRLWAVDRVILVYFALSALVLALYWTAIPDAPWLMLWHVAGSALLLYEIKRPNPTSWVFRNWYPLPYVASCYKEMALFVKAVRSTDADQWLADLDHSIWRSHPTVWLERLYSPALTEFLQIAYSLFVPIVLLVAYLLWRRGKYVEFRYYAFLIALGFLASYVGYILVPARGPRFLLSHLQQSPLRGLWLFESLQATLDRLESAHYDCFPSGHTELTILAWWSSRMVSNRLFLAYLAYTPCIIFATVYLRYHYTVDVIAGVMFAAILIGVSPWLYRELSQGA